jgi:imidazolonepropionase-like amidohydrolase
MCPAELPSIFSLRRPAIRELVAVWMLLFAAVPASAEDPAILIRDVRIFDGVSPELTAGHVFVEGQKIARVSAEPIEAPEGARVIDGEGRVLSPGLIDLHVHLTLAMPADRIRVHPWVAGALAGDVAEFFLHHGFTTVRDAGGTHPDLARAVESGLIEGPRIFPSGAVVSQTSGHGDFRLPDEPHPTLAGCGAGHVQLSGFAVLADGVPQTLAAVRENLRHGATQIKIMGGGGVASAYDPIHTLQPSPEEIRAAVQAASDWGTYVTAHAYTSEAIQRLVGNGVKMIEHGLLMDEETARLCAEKDVVVSTQVLVFRLGAEMPGLSDENRRKMQQVLEGQDRLMGYVKKYGLKIGFGTDLVFGTHVRLADEFVARRDYFEPAEIMRQATSESAEIIRMAGKLNRYENFGEIREGWLADLLLIDGNPLEDVSLFQRPEETLDLIMKAGRVVVDRTVGRTGEAD